MSAVLKSAVIGTGVISKEHLSFLNHSDLTELVGVCDLSPIAARYAAQKYGAQAAYTDYRQMLTESQPEVVHILTPPQTHKRLAIDCLEAGAHVICEKPIAFSYTDFKDIWDVAERCDRRLIEDHNYRFNRTIQAILAMVAAGELGDIQEVEVRLDLDVRGEGRFSDENLPSPMHRMPAGVIHDFISHLCYLLLLFLPEVEFDQIAAAWSNHGGDELFKYDDLDALVMGGGVHGRLRYSTYTRPDCFEITVRGSRGYAKTDLFQPHLRCVVPRFAGKQLSPLVNHWNTGWDFVNSSVRNFRDKLMQKTPYEGLHTLLDKTYSALGRQDHTPISFADMARTSQLIEALLAPENRV
ncbi:MAG: Gfo/Idh/MocA family oxidoreductase [Cyanobacteria bacterium P01_F01_bin.4]